MEHMIFEEIAKFPGAEKKYFEQLVQPASEIFLDSCNIVTIHEGKRFITAEENIDIVWILLLGQVRALEEYVSGDVYMFTKFHAPEVFGEMEMIAEIPRFRASLIAETDCVFVTVPISIYLQLLKNNSEILYSRIQIVLNRMFDEGRDNRTYLMLNGKDRIKLYFIQHYKLSESKGICMLKNTRKQIADETGYSERTVNRAIKRLSEQNFVKVVGQKIIITEIQYTSMLKSIEGKVAYYKLYKE